MTDQIRIPVSAHQSARFAEFKAQAEAVQLRFNDALTTVIAGVIDPATVQGWHIVLDGSEIVCTPRVPAKPVLVPDSSSDEQAP